MSVIVEIKAGGGVLLCRFSRGSSKNYRLVTSHRAHSHVIEICH